MGRGRINSFHHLEQNRLSLEARDERRWILAGLLGVARSRAIQTHPLPQGRHLILHAPFRMIQCELAKQKLTRSEDMVTKLIRISAGLKRSVAGVDAAADGLASTFT